MLVIWKLDRASRSTKHLIELAEELERRGVELRSLKEQIDTASAMGKFFFRMTASIAKLKRDIIREHYPCRNGGGWRERRRQEEEDRKRTGEARRLADAGKLSIT